MLAAFPLSQHFDRSWAAHVGVKAALYEAETQMAAGAALHEAEDVHIEISRLRVGARRRVAGTGHACTSGAGNACDSHCMHCMGSDHDM